jgi:hypothetical protein
MRARRSPPPFWFTLGVAVAIAIVLRLVDQAYGVRDAAPGHAPPVSIAFFGFLIALIGAIWNGLQVAGRVTLEVLAWSVKALWLFATTTANGLKALGVLAAQGLKKVWDFFGSVFERVIKPAWLKFWRWFDKFRKWLDDTFGPVLKWLQQVRKTLLDFWKTYVRPWLDLIDVTRRALRVLSSLGLGWARRLDAYLGRLEDKIQRPFMLLLAKINEVINIVNRIVTIDGLLQRVALIRSLERDYLYAWRAAVNPWRRDYTADDQKTVTDALKPKPFAQIVSETRTYMLDGTGPRAAIFDEQLAQWRIYLRS